MDLDVSRETFDRLECYVEVLKKWNPKINLVSRSSIEHIWTRHILDSKQVYDLADPQPLWLDMGSGGGLPGIVVAILAAEKSPETKVTLLESDQRKCAFLRTAARECGVEVTVVSERIEKVPPQNAGILSARALADLTQLLAFSERHLSKTGTALFPKGVTWKKEVEAAKTTWQFEHELHHSLTEPGAVILKIKGVSRV